jgi:hypothetical protein
MQSIIKLALVVAVASAQEVEYMCGDITSDRTIVASKTNILSCQTFVKSGAVLTIEAGTTIWAMPVGPTAITPPTLIVEPGGRIVAAGTATAPITFTAFNAEQSSTSTAVTDTNAAVQTTVLETRGKWGGLIILGRAPTSAATPREIEGIAGITYGGTNPTDNSGTLQYVRVWHGGAAIAADNEINGITFGGVGSGTVVDHCEVAFNVDDGFEFFGGTVNVKYLSVLFVGDDAFDSDEGYQGKGQFLFAMLGDNGNHGTEMDSKTNGNKDSQPRSHPAFWSMTILGGGSLANGASTAGLMRLREGTGGSFGNVVMAYGRDVGVKNDDCGTETRNPSRAASIDSGNANYLYFSNKNIIFRCGTPFDYGSGSKVCTDAGFTALSSNPDFSGVSSTCLDYKCLTSTFNPLPFSGSAMCSNLEAAPAGDSFYQSVSCKGAFASATDTWLSGWSWLACSGKLQGATCTANVRLSPFAQLGENVALLPATIAADTTLVAATTYILNTQTLVQPGATLTIPPGTNIYAMPPAAAATAPALVILKGGTINAPGTAALPITMTTIYAERAMQDSTTTVNTDTASSSGTIITGRRGKWGGLIVLGNAPTSAASPKQIEGITGHTYGGTNPTDNSGTLQYVRVWHGGAVIGADNEINGITFGGVGSGTIVDHCEVAFNVDDGFEFFGGTVNVKYLSVIFTGDDAFDSDEGYQGKGQFLFAMVGANGNHGTEMDSKTGGNKDSQPRSHPAFWSMTIIGGGTASTRGSSNALMRLREGTGGSFGNVILANAAGTHVGVEIKDCGSETRTQTPQAASVSIGTTGQASSGYLYFSNKNVIQAPSTAFTFDVANGCTDGAFTSVDADPGFTGTFTEVGTDRIDPRPSCGSAAYVDIQPLPAGNSFYDDVGFKGAFGNVNWLSGWGYLAVSTRLATHELNCQPVTAGGAASPAPSMPPIVIPEAQTGVPGWGVVLFVVVALLLLVVCLFVCVMIQREKVQKPIFMSFDASKAVDRRKDAV